MVGPHIYTVGGWYLDSLLAPDSSTCLHTAVERYEPWTDSWTLVSSLPMADFSFSISLSHDVPLCTAHAGSIYVLGNVQSTGEKLLLQYSVATGEEVCSEDIFACLTQGGPSSYVIHLGIKPELDSIARYSNSLPSHSTRSGGHRVGKGYCLCALLRGCFLGPQVPGWPLCEPKCWTLRAG